MADNDNLSWLWDISLASDALAWDHAMEISGTVFQRMKELDLSNKDLAARMEVSPARVTQIIRGDQSMTLATLARLEKALAIDMSGGFSHPTKMRVNSSAQA